jgi:hypothetical protein
MSDLDNSVTLTAQHGRDAGMTFKVAEVPPVEMTTFILRLLGAVRLDGVDELRALMDPTEGVDQIDVVLRLLAGCDAMAVRQLLLDMLNYVQVAPDPKHPGVFRKLNDDIRELKTLGEIVGAFVRTNVMSGL